MGAADQLSAKYNPHSISKQARQWPVLLSCSDLLSDVTARTRQLHEQSVCGWLDPFAVKLDLDSELADEYGIDACRLAAISAGTQVISQNLLESAFKWLSGFFLAQTTITHNFSPQPWLEAALQIHDQILLRQNFHAGLALMRKACKTARPGQNISHEEKELVLSTIYPFAPIMSGYLSSSPNHAPVSISLLRQHFTGFSCVRFALPRGGWHWKVFDRETFTRDPIGQLLTVKWVAMAVGSMPIKLENSAEGMRICRL